MSVLRASEHPHRLRVDGRGPRRRRQGAPPTRSRLRAPGRGRRLPRRGRVPHRPAAPLVLPSAAALASRGATSSATSSRRCSARRRSWSTRGSRAGSCGTSIKEFRPDAMVSVYPLASLVLGRMRRKKHAARAGAHLPHRLRGPLAVGAPGHRPPPRGQRDLGRGRHLTRRQAMPRARGRSSATASAIATYDRDAVRTNLGLAPEDRAVLVVAGSWGVGDVVATVEAIGRSRASSTPSPCAGATTTSAPSSSSGGYGTVIGWTDQMPALMTAADALVENAGGLTCMEAFAVGLPGHHVQADRGARQGQRRDDGPRGRQLLRARRRRAARRSSARSRAPAPSADALVDTGRAAVRGRPGRRRRGARAGRPPDRPQGPRRRPAVARADAAPPPSPRPSCLLLYAGLTARCRRPPRRSASVWPSRRRTCRAPSTSACGSTTSSWSTTGCSAS